MAIGRLIAHGDKGRERRREKEKEGERVGEQKILLVPEEKEGEVNVVLKRRRRWWW